MKTKYSGRTSSVWFYVILLSVLFCAVFPFLWMVLSSFKSIVDLMNVQRIFKSPVTFSNYIDVFKTYKFELPMFNSIFIGLAATFMALLFGLPAAYSIARERQTLFASIVLVIRIIPAITFLVPWYIIFTRIGITGTYAAIILPHLLVSLPLVIWIMIPYFESLPKELEQAAWVDGCSRMGTFVRIVLPLSTPSILTASLLSFIFSWNNFIFALVLCTGKTKTLPTAVFEFVSYTEINWSGLMAAAVTITAPILLISLFLQKHIISGLTAGAVKG